MVIKNHRKQKKRKKTTKKKLYKGKLWKTKVKIDKWNSLPCLFA